MGIGALAALVSGIVGGLVTWGFEEAKRALAERRASTKGATTS